MDAKTPTQHMFDELVEKVMLYLREADCFGEPDEDGEFGEMVEEIMEHYEGEVRAAIGTVVNPTIDVVAVYTVDDVTDRLHVLTDWEDDDAWPLERRIKLLNSVVHSSEMAQMFEHLLDEAILSGFQ